MLGVVACPTLTLLKWQSVFFGGFLLHFFPSGKLPGEEFHFSTSMCKDNSAFCPCTEGFWQESLYLYLDNVRKLDPHLMKKVKDFYFFSGFPTDWNFVLGRQLLLTQVLIALILDSLSCLWTASGQNLYWISGKYWGLSTNQDEWYLSSQSRFRVLDQKIHPESEEILAKINFFPQYLFPPCNIPTISEKSHFL